MVRFTKMHGLGNDFVIIDTTADAALAWRSDWPATAVKVCNRRHGVGADGVLLISRLPETADRHLTMRVINADGSDAEMCGNGLRCVGKYAIEHGVISAAEGAELRVDVAGRVLTLRCFMSTEGCVTSVQVDMGAPVTELSAQPVTFGRLAVPSVQGQSPPDAALLGSLLSQASFVSIPNPHAIMFVRDVSAVPLEQLGPAIECHPAFSLRINAQFAQVVSRTEIRLRTWERGAGATLACGTGAAAACVAAALRGLADRSMLVHLPGGALHIDWRLADNHVLMTGPAVEVFTGSWPG